MKKMFLVFAAGLLAAASLTAQSSNPTSRLFRATLKHNQRNMVGSAKEMPAAKYGYHPTPQQMTFRHLIKHATMANYYLCAVITGAHHHAAMPKSNGKAALVKALSGSYVYCNDRLAHLTDASLSKPVTLFGRMHTTVGGAMLVAAGDWSDHYAIAAMYLRLNGKLPPSAQHGRMARRK